MIKKIMVGVLAASFFSYGADYIKLKKPPKDLDKYYPPASEKPVFLYNMYTASISFTGMLANIQEGDWKNAKKWAESLKKAYLKVGKLVPAWDKFLRKDEINKLVEAVNNKNTAKVKMYAQKVGQSCSSCHKKYMLPVKVKYHYPSYDLISIEDPVSGNEYEVEDYMKKIATDYKLVNVYSSDGKYKKALKMADSFSKRFKALTQMCSECHTSKIVEDVYFGEETENALKALKKAIVAKNHKNINKQMGAIGGTCYKCHNVHEVPIMLKDKLLK